MHKMIALLISVGILLSPAFITNAAADSGDHVPCDTEITEVPPDDEIDQAELAAMGDYGGNLTGATWYWPLHGYSSATAAYSKIQSSYGHRGGSFNKKHYGVDIAEPNGTPIYPVRSGIVLSVNTNASHWGGLYVVVDHQDGYFSVYMHMSKLHVSAGQRVNVNTQIGAVGSTGDSTGNHLHLSIHYGSSFPSPYHGNVNPCPPGYERRGDSLQASAGGYPVGTPTISYVCEAKNFPIDVGVNFYGYIINTSRWKHLTRDSDWNVVMRTETGKSNQIWHFEKQSDGAYKITSAEDGRCIEVCDFGQAPKTNVQVNDYNGNSAQHWYIYGESPFYQFRGKCTDCVFGVADGESADGTNIEMQELNGADTQLFQIWRLELPSIPTPTLTIDVKNVVDHNAIFSWEPVSNAHYYDIRIRQDGEIIKTLWAQTGTYCSVDLPAGTYSANIAAVNENFKNYSFSDDISFTVPASSVADPIAHMRSTVTQSGDMHRVETKLENCPSSGKAFVVGYKNGQFVTLEIVPCRGESVTSTLHGDIDEIKVLLLDSTTLGPLCENEDIPSGKWR